MKFKRSCARPLIILIDLGGYGYAPETKMSFGRGDLILRKPYPHFELRHLLSCAHVLYCAAPSSV